MLRGPPPEQTDTAHPSRARLPNQLNLDNLQELAVRLRRGLGHHVAGGLLTVAEANDMVARVDGLIAQQSRFGGRGSAGAVAPS